jgi:DNA-binding transcriptional regulator YdaS (Cro superfamily)
MLAQTVATHGAQSELARLLGCAPQLVWQWAAGVRAIPRDRCPDIERATKGAVTVEQLRPDVVWQRVPDPAWPHPDGRPCVDVARRVRVEMRDAA